MAEGRSVNELTEHLSNIPVDHLTVVDTHHARWNGLSVTPTNDGLVVFIPKPRYLWRLFKRKMYRLHNQLVTSLYPAPPAATFVSIGAFVSFVVSKEDSTWRRGPLADLLWNIDERCNLFKGVMSRNARVGYIAAGATLAGVLTLMACNRVFLRMLLRYRGFMYEKKPSIATMVWAGCLKTIYAPQKLLGKRTPLLYSYQNALPHLPVPPLAQTVQGYLESVKPLFDETKFAKLVKDATQFQATIGPKLNLGLNAKRYLFSSNYVSDWWVKYVYLKGRSSLLINSNYYGMGFAYARPCKDQLSRAAVLVHGFLKVQEKVFNETLEPMLLRGLVPLDMAQYQLLFGTSRVPGRDCDSLEQPNANPKHIVVSCLGQYFSLETVNHKTHRKLTVPELYAQLCHVHKVAHDTAAKTGRDTWDKKVSLLTAGRRDKWAEIREDHLLHGVNRTSLAKIETASFVLALDENAPKDWTEQGHLQLHGDGHNRWIDKSLTLVVFADGRAGVHAEHTWGDAPTVAHAWEINLASEASHDYYNEESTLLKPDLIETAKQCTLDQGVQRPRPLRWDLCDSLVKEMKLMDKDIQLAIDALRLKVICFGMDKDNGEFGKGAIKKVRLSPDGFIQMALQLAYRREAGKNCLTYESGMTRLFLEGRTETVRSLSNESSAFVDLMMKIDANKASATSTSEPDGDVTLAGLKKDCRDALKLAVDRHTLKSKDAMAGNGIDRHLFALYVMGKGLGYVDEDLSFLSEALSVPWTMSTSQLPQRQTVGCWPDAPGVHNMSPSGGFGPVADDGYGISYMIAGEDHIFFHVSSKKVTGNGEPTTTDSDRFAETIKQSLKDIMQIYNQI